MDYHVITTPVHERAAPAEPAVKPAEEAARTRKRGEQEPPERFFPNFLFKEALVALVAFILLTLIVVYAKIPMERVADPTDTSYVPRPEWYFLFLFQTLKYFPGKYEPLATVALPGTVILAMLALPFIDRRPRRTRGPRPLATTVAVIAVSLVVLLTFLAVRSTPAQVESGTEGNVVLTPAQAAGQQLYKSLKCNACHSVNGDGGNTGPDLGQVGSRHDTAWLHTFLEDPKANNPNAAMNSYLGKLTHQEIENLAQYLAVLK